jgi:beta-glucanase (GH16 family)
MHRWILRTRVHALAALVAALVLVAIGAASPAISSAAAASPNCGSTVIPKQVPAPTSKPASKKKRAKKHGKKRKKSASKKRKRSTKKRAVARTATAGNWACTFSDDFDGTSLDTSKWIAQRTATSGYTSGKTACFVDSPNNVSVSNGTLQLTARTEASPFTCSDPTGNFNTQYTSGMVSTAGGRFSQAYGRFEVRARVSSARLSGLQSSFWLWPVDANKYGAWPASGEIDIAELYSQYADRAIPYIHYSSADPNVTNNSCIIGSPDAFHTYAVEWSPSTIKVIYDGNTCLIDTLAGSHPFDQPFIVVLTQALGIGTNQFDPATTPLPATTTIDYVRAWD